MTDDADNREAATALDPPVAPSASFDRWLLVLHQVTQGAMAHLDLRELLRELLARIREAMAVDNAAILLVDDDRQQLTLYAARGPEEQVTGEVRVPMGKGVAGSIAASAQPRIIDDLSAVEVENPLLRARMHSLVGVPLLIGGEVRGVIHVDSARPRRFTQEDVQLLEVIAGRAALAIEHAQLYAAERAAPRQLRALQTVSDVALEHAGLSDLLDALMERIRQTMHVDNVAILLPEPGTTELTLYNVHGPETAIAPMVRVPIGRGVAGTIMASGQPLIIDDLSRSNAVNPFLRERLASLLGVPLWNGEQVVGVLHISTVAPRHFSDEERELLESIAARIGPAIDRAQAYEAMRERRVAAERQIQSLEETAQRMDEFLSIASHELRTPLTSLNTNLQLLDYWLVSQRSRRVDESEVDFLAHAMRSAQPLIGRAQQAVGRLDRLIGELLDASRVQQKRLGLHLEPCDLNAIVREIVDDMRQAHSGRTIHLALPARAPLRVVGDVDRIGQVLTNVLGNALKFSERTAPIWIRVQVEGRGKAARARVEVRDRGPGIPPEAQAHLWERFYRVPGGSHRTGSQVGLGLGLYISRDIVERHGGQMGVESIPGEGSTFWFTLPLEQAAPTTDEAPIGKPANGAETRETNGERADRR